MANKLNKNIQHLRIVLFAFLLGATVGKAIAQVSLPNGTVSENAVDLTVKTIGGAVSIDRQFENGRWQINMRWAPAVLSGEAANSSSCREYPELKIQGRTYNGDGQTWLLENRYSARATEFFDGQDCLANRIKMIRWQDRNTGNWMEYVRTDSSDLQFHLGAYGDRNNVATKLIYDSQGRTKTVVDHFGKVIFEYTYSGELLTEIKDNPAIVANNILTPRSVKYEYANVTDGSGKSYSVISKVIDVFGNQTQYDVSSGNITQVVDAEGRIRRYAYTAGRVTKYIDPEGKETAYIYDYDKNKKEFYVRINYPETSAGKRLSEQWYNSDGQLIRRDINGKTDYQKTAVDTANRSDTQIDSAGQQTVTFRDEFGNVIKTVYSDGSQSTSTYSSVHGQIVEDVDELGIKTGYEYDGKGNPLRKIEAMSLPEQRITEYVHDAVGQLIKETRRGKPESVDSSGQDASISYEYDSNGNRIKKTDAMGNITRYAYDITGSVVQLTDAANHVWKIETDKIGRTVAHINPLNFRTTWLYDKVGNRIKITDALNNATSFIFDGADRIRKSINALGGIRQTEYDEQGQSVAEINEAGKIIGRTTYDLLGRLINMQDGANNITSYEYDDTTNSMSPIRIRYGKFTQDIRYDARGRDIETIQTYQQFNSTGDASVINTSSKTVYDKKGQSIELVDRLGNKTQISYDALGRVKATTDANGSVTKFTYDTRDNLLALTDANGNTTKYEYDGNNRRVKEIRPMGQTTSYVYDEVGNVINIVDAKNNQIKYTYDAAGRRIKELHFLAKNNASVRTISYSYDSVGNMTGYSDTNNGHNDHIALSQSYVFDALQRKTEEKTTLGGNTVNVKTSFTVTGKKATQTLSDGSVLTYQYTQGDDAQNKGGDFLQAIQLPDTGSISILERTWNHPSQVVYPGGTIRKMSYDALLRLEKVQVKLPNQQLLLGYDYRFDVEGNITAKQTEHGEYKYMYDNLSRLTQVTPDIFSGQSIPTEKFTYDKLGNRITDKNQGGAIPWKYNSNSQLVQSFFDTAGTAGDADSKIEYQYDNNGSVIKKSTSSSGVLLNNQTYIYDAANRLAEAQDNAGNVIATYQYDPQGRRIRKTVYREVNGNMWLKLATPKTLTYFYNDDGLSAEYIQTGAGKNLQDTPVLQAQYGWQPDSTWGTDPLFIKTTRINGASSTPEYFYYQNDHLGTPQKIVDGQGQVVWSQRSTVFGKAIRESIAVNNNLGLPGQYFDEELGTYQNYFRDYDPSLGRYIQSDPLGVLSDLASYAYARGNALTQYDYLGLCSFTIQYRQNWKPKDSQVITMSEWDSKNPKYEWTGKGSMRPSTNRVPGKACYTWVGSYVTHYMLKRRVDHEQLIEEIKVCETCEEDCRNRSSCSGWMFNRIVNDRWVWWNVPWIESYYKGYEENPNPYQICLPLPPLGVK